MDCADRCAHSLPDLPLEWHARPVLELPRRLLEQHLEPNNQLQRPRSRRDRAGTAAVLVEVELRDLLRQRCAAGDVRRLEDDWVRVRRQQRAAEHEARRAGQRADDDASCDEHGYAPLHYAVYTGMYGQACCSSQPSLWLSCSTAVL